MKSTPIKGQYFDPVVLSVQLQDMRGHYVYAISNYCVVGPTDEPVDDEDIEMPEITVLAENIACYICGYVVRQELRRTTCDECKNALVAPKPADAVADEDYRCFLQLRDNGGLIMPSRSVFLIGTRKSR